MLASGARWMISFEFQTTDICSVLKAFQQPELYLYGCSFIKRGNTLSDFFGSKFPLEFYKTCINLSIFGKCCLLISMTTLKLFRYKKEKTKVVGLLFDIQANSSFKKISLSGDATPKEWMTLLERMIQNKGIEKIRISTYSFRRDRRDGDQLQCKIIEFDTNKYTY